MTIKILVVEDEPKVASFLKEGLEEQLYEVDVAYDGEMGRALALKNKYDVIILDLIIPYINGIDLCKEIRNGNSASMILMLTALGTTEEKVKGFNAGADDYLVKPFEFNELLARIKALTKRRSGIIQPSNTLQVADLVLDLNKKIAMRNNREIELTAKEFNLLEFLIRNKNRVVSRVEIAEQVWNITFDTGTNIIDVYVNYLRKKVDKDFPVKLIHTHIGMGYILKETE